MDRRRLRRVHRSHVISESVAAFAAEEICCARLPWVCVDATHGYPVPPHSRLLRMFAGLQMIGGHVRSLGGAVDWPFPAESGCHSSRFGCNSSIRLLKLIAVWLITCVPVCTWNNSKYTVLLLSLRQGTEWTRFNGNRRK